MLRVGANSPSRTIALAGALMLGLAAPALGQSFPSSPENETETSLGKFIIRVAPSFQPFVQGSNTPVGYTYSNGYLTSPLLNDSYTTIGVSAGTTVGDSVTTTSPGVLTGANAAANAVYPGSPALTSTYVLDNSAFYPKVPATFSNAKTGTPEVFTEIQLFDLTNGSGTNVLAGASAGGAVPNSYGQVQSTNSNPSLDFPAQSFFDIFVDIQVPLPSGPTVNLENMAPLVVESNDLPGPLPPKVLYTHTGSGNVPIYIVASPNSPLYPYNGDVFGSVVVTGHGVGYNIDNPNDVKLFDQQFSQLAVPEPATWAMMVIGFAGLGYGAYRRSKRSVTNGVSLQPEV